MLEKRGVKVVSTFLSDELKDAMKIASEEVGKDWTYLYQKLPFAPSRDFEKRSHDIEGETILELLGLGQNRT